MVIDGTPRYFCVSSTHHSRNDPTLPKKTDQVFLKKSSGMVTKCWKKGNMFTVASPFHSSLGIPCEREDAEVTVVVNILTPCDSKGKRSSGEKIDR